MGLLARITQWVRDRERKQRLQNEHDKLQDELNALCMQCWFHDMYIHENERIRKEKDNGI